MHYTYYTYNSQEKSLIIELIILSGWGFSVYVIVFVPSLSALYNKPLSLRYDKTFFLSLWTHLEVVWEGEVWGYCLVCAHYRS